MVLTAEQQGVAQQNILTQISSEQGQRELQLRALSAELARAESTQRRRGHKSTAPAENVARIRAEIDRISSGGQFTPSATAQAIQQRIVQNLPTKFQEDQSVAQRVQTSQTARASGGLTSSALPGSFRGVEAESLYQQSLVALTAGNQQLAATLQRQAAESSQREVLASSEREALFAQPTAVGQFEPGRASRRTPNILETAAEKRAIPFVTEQGVTKSLVRGEQRPVIALSEKAAAKIAAEGGGVTVFEQGITPQGRPVIGPVRAFTTPQLSPEAERSLLETKSDYGAIYGAEPRTETPGTIPGRQPIVRPATEEELAPLRQFGIEGTPQTAVVSPLRQSGGILPAGIGIVGPKFTKEQQDILEGKGPLPEAIDITGIDFTERQKEFLVERGFNPNTGQPLPARAYTAEEKQALFKSIRTEQARVGIGFESVLAPGVSPKTLEKGRSTPSEIASARTETTEIVQKRSEELAKIESFTIEYQKQFGFILGPKNAEKPEFTKDKLGGVYIEGSRIGDTEITLQDRTAKGIAFEFLTETGLLAQKGGERIEQAGRFLTNIESQSKLPVLPKPIKYATTFLGNVEIGVGRFIQAGAERPVSTVASFYVLGKAFKVIEAVPGLIGRAFSKVAPKTSELISKATGKATQTIVGKAIVAVAKNPVVTFSAVPSGFAATTTVQRFVDGDVREGEGISDIFTQEAVLPFAVQAIGRTEIGRERIKKGVRTEKARITEKIEVTGVSVGQGLSRTLVADIPVVRGGDPNLVVRQTTGVVAKTRTRTTTKRFGRTIKSPVVEDTQVLKVLQKAKGYSAQEIAIITGNIKAGKAIPKYDTLIRVPDIQTSYPGKLVTPKVPVKVGQQALKIITGKEAGTKILFGEDVIRTGAGKAKTIVQQRNKYVGEIRDSVNQAGKDAQRLVKAGSEEPRKRVSKFRNLFTQKETKQAFTGPSGPITDVSFSQADELLSFKQPKVLEELEAITGKTTKLGRPATTDTINVVRSLDLYKNAGQLPKGRQKPDFGRSPDFKIPPKTQPPKPSVIPKRLPDQTTNQVIQETDKAASVLLKKNLEVKTVPLSQKTAENVAKAILNKTKISTKKYKVPVYEERAVTLGGKFTGQISLVRTNLLFNQKGELRNLPQSRFDTQPITRQIPGVVPRVIGLPDTDIFRDLGQPTRQIPTTAQQIIQRSDQSTQQIVQQITGGSGGGRPDVPVPPEIPIPIIIIPRLPHGGFGPQYNPAKSPFQGERVYKGLSAKQYAAIITKNTKIPRIKSRSRGAIKLF